MTVTQRDRIIPFHPLMIKERYRYSRNSYLPVHSHAVHIVVDMTSSSRGRRPTEQTMSSHRSLHPQRYHISDTKELRRLRWSVLPPSQIQPHRSCRKASLCTRGSGFRPALLRAPLKPYRPVHHLLLELLGRTATRSGLFSACSCSTPSSEALRRSNNLLDRISCSLARHSSSSICNSSICRRIPSSI